MNIIQSIFFDKNKYDLETCRDFLIKNNYGNYQRINTNKYYYRFTYCSRIKLQYDNYIKQIKIIKDGIKIEYYNKINNEINFVLVFD